MSFFTQLFGLAPRSAADFFKRAVTYFDRGEFDKAIADCTEAIARDPDLAAAYYERGLAREIKGDPDGAIADHTEAIRLDPKYADAYWNRGIAWSEKGDHRRAIEDFQVLMRLRPRNSTAYVLRGIEYAATGAYRQAIADYTEAIRRNPGEAAAYLNLANLWASCPEAAFRNGPGAVEYANKAGTLLQWRVLNCFQVMAAAYAEVGDFEEAICWQQKALEFPGISKDGLEDCQLRLAQYVKGNPWRHA